MSHPSVFTLICFILPTRLCNSHFQHPAAAIQGLGTPFPDFAGHYGFFFYVPEDSTVRIPTVLGILFQLYSSLDRSTSCINPPHNLKLLNPSSFVCCERRAVKDGLGTLLALLQASTGIHFLTSFFVYDNFISGAESEFL
ncbi:hypothetical protein B0H14DRAFT_2647992 [Mycena olivaceomarginata]|nr:hypothetical protein B0H14DRAFT_2647992 [Mycena olivaceomarginata]